MSGEFIDKVDLEARRRAAKIIHEKFSKVLESVLEGKPPVLEIPKRTLANTRFDPERGILVMGEEIIRRELLNMGEARRFMQTLLMAAIIYQALVENEYPTIRDLYYRGKHTIVYRDLRGRTREENTWDEQSESDAVIRDVEVFTGLLREDMLILSKEKGKVVGRMRIRSGGDVIDLSKMGHGAYAIESTPDLIEFLDVDAEFVLVVEKDAVFQQLHRIKFWDTYRALLVTGAGQPDRATRRFVRRLHEELGLPIYVLTDSIPADEVVIARINGETRIAPVEELLGPYFTPGLDKERIDLEIEVPAFDPETGRIAWSRIGYAYRHYVREKILRIRTHGRGTVRVTKAHSLFVWRDGRITVVPAGEIRPGDYIVVAHHLPPLTTSTAPVVLDLKRLVIEEASRGGYSSRFNIEATLHVVDKGTGVQLIRLSRSNVSVPSKLVLDEDVAWLLGLYTSDGSSTGGRYIRIHLAPHEEHLAMKAARVFREKFNVNPTIRRSAKEVVVHVNSRLLHLAFQRLGLAARSRYRRVPEQILNSPPSIQVAYIRGLIDGDGSIDRDGSIVYSTRSKVLAKQVFNMLLSLGALPTLVENGEDNIIRIGKSPGRTDPLLYRLLTGREPGASVRGEQVYGIPYTGELKRILVSLAARGYASYSPASKTITKSKLSRIGKLIGGLPGDYGVLAFGDVVLVKVTDIEEEEYEGYVYDFMVPAGNSFTGGYGIVYHNSDPYGFYIYSVYKVGSIQLSYESERLATPKARFLGVSMTDIFGYRGKRPYLTERERRNFIIKATERDIKRARELMHYSWFQTPKWRRELRLFLQKKAKLEIEALASKGLRFLAHTYIPEKIQTGDWIE